MCLICADCTEDYSEKLEIFLLRVEDFCEQKQRDDENTTSQFIEKIQEYIDLIEK